MCVYMTNHHLVWPLWRCRYGWAAAAPAYSCCFGAAQRSTLLRRRFGPKRITGLQETGRRYTFLNRCARVLSCCGHAKGCRPMLQANGATSSGMPHTNVFSRVCRRIKLQDRQQAVVARSVNMPEVRSVCCATG
jgi:hypothetical protein